MGGGEIERNEIRDNDTQQTVDGAANAHHYNLFFLQLNSYVNL